MHGCTSSHPSSSHQSNESENDGRLTASQIVAMYQPQVDSLRQAFREIAKSLPAQIPKHGLLKMGAVAPPRCRERGSNVTFVAEERLKDPANEPIFQLGLAELCGGTNVVEFLRWPKPQKGADELAKYERQEFDTMLNIPYIVVMRTTRFVPPRMVSRTSPEEKGQAWKKEVCADLTPDDCDRAVKQYVAGLRMGTIDAGIYTSGVVVVDMFLVDVNSRKVLGAIRIRAENDPKVTFESYKTHERDERFAEVLLADLRRNAITKARAALDEAFELFR